jgi:hypothetical protein
MEHVRRRNPSPRPARGRPRVDVAGYRAGVTEYFEARRRRMEIVATTTTHSGQVIDWIPVESQVPGGRIASPPPHAPVRLHDGDRKIEMARFELESPGVERGPEGTVPVPRKDFSKIQVRCSLRDYLSKDHRRGVRSRLARKADPSPNTAGHHYAFTSQGLTCFGGEGNLSIWDPFVENDDDFSLLQIGLANFDFDNTQTVEAGWQVFQDKFGDWSPHLFTYYTTNDYSQDGDNQGGYDQEVDGWVQYDSSIHPGALITTVSVHGGVQYILPIKYQLYEQDDGTMNWWFRCSGRWLGYYPAGLFMGNQSIFATLGDHAEQIAFWGEVFFGESPTYVNMGSGFWAEDGWQWAAFQSNLLAQTDRGGTLTDYNGGSGYASDPGLYDILTDMESGSTWGSYFWLGGPGAG